MLFRSKECILDSGREEVGGVEDKEWDAKGGSKVGAPSTEVVKNEVVETVSTKGGKGVTKEGNNIGEEIELVGGEQCSHDSREGRPQLMGNGVNKAVGEGEVKMDIGVGDD